MGYAGCLGSSAGASPKDASATAAVSSLAVVRRVRQRRDSARPIDPEGRPRSPPGGPTDPGLADPGRPTRPHARPAGGRPPALIDDGPGGPPAGRVDGDRPCGAVEVEEAIGTGPVLGRASPRDPDPRPARRRVPPGRAAASAGRMILHGGHARIGRNRLRPPPRSQYYDVGSHLQRTARKGVPPWLTAERARGALGRLARRSRSRPGDRSGRTCSVRRMRARRSRRAAGPPLRPPRGWAGCAAATAPWWVGGYRSSARGCGRRPAGSGPGARIPHLAPRTSSRADIRRPPGPWAGSSAEGARGPVPRRGSPGSWPSPRPRWWPGSRPSPSSSAIPPIQETRCEHPNPSPAGRRVSRR
jgi:hypothetical protein